MLETLQMQEKDVACLGAADTSSSGWMGLRPEGIGANSTASASALPGTCIQGRPASVLFRVAAGQCVTLVQVHDPASAGGSVGPGATLGDLSGLASGPGFEMVGGDAFDAEKAYKDSKLCNVLFARELARRLQAKGSRVTVNSFGPGAPPGSHVSAGLYTL